MEYFLCWSYDARDLSNFVNERLKKGWKLYGDSFCAKRDVGGKKYEKYYVPQEEVMFCQAMVKYDESEKE